MDEKEKMIQNFGDMVSATERMSAPWQKEAHEMKTLCLLTNLFWAIIVGLLIWFAYMTPMTVTQDQDYVQQHQSQAYTEGATNW